jgi:hypothetical protein
MITEKYSLPLYGKFFFKKQTQIDKKKKEARRLCDIIHLNIQLS